MTAGVRTDANISAHAYGLASYLDNTVYRFCSHRSTVAAEEHIFGYAAIRKEVLSRAEVLEHPFTQQRTFWNNTLFISLAMNKDILILDLPRDGIHPKALPKLIAYGVDRIVYVSCKPTSLARDMAVFNENGYYLEKAAAVDMFPGTANTEVVALIVRKG